VAKVIEWLVISFFCFFLLAGCNSLMTQKTEDYSINVKVEQTTDGECRAEASAVRQHEDAGQQTEVKGPPLN
jgi:hypothetical protein